MCLSQRLSSVGLTFLCPQCNFTVIKNGSWFRGVSRYRCDGCGREIRITYPDKIAIFHKHAHLATRPPGALESRSVHSG
ncbi:transposase-like zinc-binding domain-containing protein [Mesorhizobium prunaredense]